MKTDLFYKPLIREAWALTKKYYWVIFLFGLINITVSGTLQKLAEQKSLNFVLAGVVMLAMIVFTLLFKFWSQRLEIWVASSKKFNFVNIFEVESYKKFVNYLSTVVIYGLIVLGGLVLLIIPGIVWALKYFLAPYFALDKGMNYKEALKASAEATKGVRTKIFVLGLLMFLSTIGTLLIAWLFSIIAFEITIFIFIAFLTLLFLALIIVPLCFVTTGLLYVRLSGNTENVIVNDDIVPQPLEISEPLNG